MIRALLHREPSKRLGSKSGAAELKKCEFLQDVKWDNIRKMLPPYLPHVQDPLELVNKPSSLRETHDAALDCCLAWCPEVLAHQEKSKGGSKAATRPTAAAESETVAAGKEATESTGAADSAGAGVNGAAEAVANLTVESS